MTKGLPSQKNEWQAFQLIELNRRFILAKTTMTNYSLQQIKTCIPINYDQIVEFCQIE